MIDATVAHMHRHHALSVEIEHGKHHPSPILAILCQMFIGLEQCKLQQICRHRLVTAGVLKQEIGYGAAQRCTHHIALSLSTHAICHEKQPVVDGSRTCLWEDTVFQGFILASHTKRLGFQNLKFHLSNVH